MNSFVKIHFLLVILVACSLCDGVDIRNNGFLVQLDKPPRDFHKLSAQAKADVLCSIAESSYKILTTVPQKGLRDSRDSFKKIASFRKWLEDSRDVNAMILAMSLQYGVDSAVLNEMYREEKQRHGRPLKKVFKHESFDGALVNSFLRQNEINEHEYIDFALGLDTEIGKFCQQNNYKPRDFLTHKFFEEAPSEKRRIYLPRNEYVDSNEVKEAEKADIRDADFTLVMSWGGGKMESQKNLAKFLLPIVLNCIDEARDVRLLARIYMKHGGFADKVKMPTPIVYSHSLKNRVLAELSSEKIGRLTSGSRGSDPVISVDASIITGKIESRIDAGAEGKYEVSLAFRFVPFVRNSEVFPEKFGKFMKKQGLLGIWLTQLD